MNIDLTDDSIVIIKDTKKTESIREIRKSHPLKIIKIIGLKEFEKKFYFDYTKETVFYIHKKYGVIKSIAEMYIKNLYYTRQLDDEKINFLEEMKKDLEEQNLLKKDEMFKEYIKDKKIYIYDLRNIDLYYDRMFEELSHIADVEYIDIANSRHTLKPLYILKNKSLEIEFVATEIAKLLKSGIDINKIFIANIQEDTIGALERVFKDYKIPLELKNNNSILKTNLVEKFVSNLDKDIPDLENLKENIKTPKDEKIFKNIVDVINNYYWCDNYLEVKDFIIDDLSKISTPHLKFKDAIRTIDFLDRDIKDDEYVFLINFNQGSYPLTKNDEDYLNDDIKTKLGLSTSIDYNKNLIKKVQEKIQSTKNLTVSLRERSIEGELYKSPAYDKSLFEECTFTREFTHSNAYNLKELIKEKDENRKYGTTTKELALLSNHYKETPYLDYDNTFKGIPKEKVMNHLNNELVLSYSSMSTYYQCAFRYYLDNILKMDTFEDTFDTAVGTIFHRVLSFAFLDDFDFENIWAKAVDEIELELKTKEKFFLSILKEELKFIIESINEGMEYTALKNALYEQKITIKIDDQTTFKGFVDKILYGNFDDLDIAVIIDYKTGIQDLKLDNIIYGVDLQLPTYAYLLGSFEPLKNAHIGGFYLQKILNNTNSLEKKKDALKLIGYSNKDVEILRQVDSSYKNSKIIKSLKTSANGFYRYSKVLSDDEISDIKNIVENKIKESAINIKNAEFPINPKEIDGKIYGCKFCKYEDICFKKAKDIIKLEKPKKDDLGGEEDANMD